MLHQTARIAFAIVAASLACLLAEAVERQEVVLPADCKVLNIVGEGFTLTLENFKEMRKSFDQAASESSQVKSPREAAETVEDSRNLDGIQPSLGDGEVQEADSPTGGDHATSEPNDYGMVGMDLERWISSRATFLLQRLDRYNGELVTAAGGNRIVIQVLYLNTLVELEKLINQELDKFMWVEAKLRSLKTSKENKIAEVRQFVERLIERNKLIENNLSGTNKPGPVWMTNVYSIRRIRHEQQFSSELRRIINEYLSGKFNLMTRAVVYQLNGQPKRLDDGLYYLGAKNLVPADFPFSAQDAISHW